MNDKTITLGDKVYPMLDCDFPTIDPADPYTLTEEENHVINQLTDSFENSEKLQRHIRYLYSKGPQQTNRVKYTTAQPAQKQLFPALMRQNCSGYCRPRCSCHTGHRPHEAQRQRRMRQQKRTRRQQQHTASHTAAKGSQQHSSRCLSARRSGRLAQIFSSHKTRPLAQSTLCKGACVLCLLTS